MLKLILRVNQYIVNKYYYKLIKIVKKEIINIVLKYSRSISQSKKHYFIFIDAIVDLKNS